MANGKLFRTTLKEFRDTGMYIMNMAHLGLRGLKI